jgi:hypothetical protein
MNKQHLHTLPKSLLTLIGEYGHACANRASDSERLHRWELLIDGIKQYAADEIASVLDYDCEDCIGMCEHGCFCKAMGAVQPGGPTA